ncbi:MAG TPA: amidase [Candidatus Eisenbacteria bacterium]|nr:amidase [Candidatus Eisenbacteria bacterium]
MTEWTAGSLAEAIRARKLSPVEAVQGYLERIERLNPKLRAFITVDAEGALRRARALAEEPPRGPLHGVPLAYKDLCAVKGLPTSCGTRTPDYFLSGHDCTAVARLSRAGAVTLGKLNMSELAMGPFGDNAHHGDAQNPWRLGHITGGSSSGSAGAVAARLCAGALGSDTGGSIRLPAAACGIVGLKPTYGRVSRAGAMALSWSYDHLGPMTLTVRDCALLLGIIAGRDPADATASSRRVPDYLAALDAPVRGMRIGVPENYYFDGLHPEVDKAVREAITALGGLGTRVETLRVPDPEPMVAACNNMMVSAEAASIHSRILKERPGELQPAVLARLAPGLRVSAYDYIQGSRLRAQLTREFIADVFSTVDVLVAPTIPEPAPTLAEAKAGTTEDVVRRMGQFSRLTRPFNALGLPALSVPCGFSSDGLPISLQVIGRPFDEISVLRLGQAYEQAAGWHMREPKLD